MKTYCLLFVLLIFANTASLCQDNRILFYQSDIFQAFTFPQSTKKSFVSLDVEKIKEEDKTDSLRRLPPRFGIPHQVDFNQNNSGVWVELGNGDRVWLLEIECCGAKSINILFDDFYLPPSSTLHIYNKDSRQLLNRFTSINNRGTQEDNKGFCTGLIFDNHLILEYYEPCVVKNEGKISIDKIVHGYRFGTMLSFFEENGKNSGSNFGESGDCNVNVNCPEGDSWQNEKTSVALVVVDGHRYCSGCLINNTKEDGTPYFLTANHCLGGWANSIPLDAASNPYAPYWSFYWNYESPDCGNGLDFEPIMTSGAEVVANDRESDFALLLLDESPYDVGIAPYFSGWERRNTPASSAVGIHQPWGDIKKICIENNALISTWYQKPESSPSASHWKVSVWDIGLTEPGSSGSPLFNQEHRIVGQLHGGDAECFQSAYNGMSDWYGKLSYSWESGGSSPLRNLRLWLDPIGAGDVFLDGRYFPICEHINFANRQITNPETITGCKIFVNNISISEGINLAIIARHSVTIENDFEMQSGSSVQIEFVME